jgi:hypothetical protein
MKGYFLDRRSRGHEARADLEALAEQERLVRKYALDRDYGTKHWQPDNDAKLLADAHGRGNEYGAMRVAGMFVHGLSTVTSERYWLTDEGVYVVGGASPNPKRYERDAALFASHSMLLSARAVCRIFGWAEPPDVADLLEELGQEVQRPRDSSSS